MSSLRIWRKLSIKILQARSVTAHLKWCISLHNADAINSRFIYLGVNFYYWNGCLDLRITTQRWTVRVWRLGSGWSCTAFQSCLRLCLFCFKPQFFPDLDHDIVAMHCSKQENVGIEFVVLQNRPKAAFLFWPGLGLIHISVFMCMFVSYFFKKCGEFECLYYRQQVERDATNVKACDLKELEVMCTYFVTVIQLLQYHSMLNKKSTIYIPSRYCTYIPACLTFLWYLLWHLTMFLLLQVKFDVFLLRFVGAIVWSAACISFSHTYYIMRTDEGWTGGYLKNESTMCRNGKRADGECW